ncbi:putative toxin-antitoxin system toxin component, PIN family [Candidatus Parcubacteria bacterium]|nr:putative toxin-antitoxin system toxin component, PIN family [Candidatus Parcubacteria bacterium]
MIKIVLDANIYVSAILSPNGKPWQIIDLVKNNKINLLISLDILSEIKQVMLYPKIVKLHRCDSKEITEFLERLLSIAIVTPGNLKINIIKEDPADNKYLECAIEGNADFVISGDHHLTNLKIFQGIKIITPAMFLKLMDY